MDKIQMICQEIERRLRSIENCPFIAAELGAEQKVAGETNAYKDILRFIDSLPDEQKADADKMYEDAQQRVCDTCSLHKDCAWVIRGMERKCNYLSDVMYGYELCQQDMKKAATEWDAKKWLAACNSNDNKIEIR